MLDMVVPRVMVWVANKKRRVELIIMVDNVVVAEVRVVIQVVKIEVEVVVEDDSIFKM